MPVLLLQTVEFPPKQNLPRSVGITNFHVPLDWRSASCLWVTSTRAAEGLDFTIMAVKIRLKRVGTKNTPAFRIVVADGRSPRDGKFIEEIGTYLPLQKGDNVKIKLDRANYWIGVGAQPSDTVASFIKKATKAAPAA